MLTQLIIFLVSTFIHARLVMNRHLYGPHSGLPLATLNRTCSSPRTGWKLSATAQIIDDELYLCVTHTCEIHSDLVLRRLIDIRHRTSCCLPMEFHRSDNTLTPAFGPDKLSLEGHGYARWRILPGSCSKCWTDWTMTIERAEADSKRPTALRPQWRMTLTSYHCLGRCREPQDRKWSILTQREYYRRRIELGVPVDWYRYMAPDLPGSVRRRWKAEARHQKQEEVSGVTKVCEAWEG